MSVSVDDVKYIAQLSMLRFDDKEIEQFTQEFNKIIEYIDQLNDLDLSDVEPLYHPVEGSKATLREDEPVPSLNQEKAFKNSPQREGDHFAVPKVINSENK